MEQRIRFWVVLLVAVSLPLLGCALYYRTLAPERGGLLTLLVQPAVLMAMLFWVWAWTRQPRSPRLILLGGALLAVGLGVALV